MSRRRKPHQRRKGGSGQIYGEVKIVAIQCFTCFSRLAARSVTPTSLTLLAHKRTQHSELGGRHFPCDAMLTSQIKETGTIASPEPEVGGFACMWCSVWQPLPVSRLSPSQLQGESVQHDTPVVEASKETGRIAVEIAPGPSMKSRRAAASSH